MEVFPEIFQIIVSTSSPSHSAFVGPAAAESLSPEHRREYFDHENNDGDENGNLHSSNADEFIEHQQQQQSSSGKIFFTSGGGNNAATLSLQKRLNNLISHHHPQQPNVVAPGQQVTVGGTKRQYILIFNEDHVTEVWYKTMTKSVEEWTDRYAGGLLIKKKQEQEKTAKIKEEQELKPKENGNREGDEMFVSEDVLDVEKAISHLDRDYYRDDLGWSSPKQQQQQQRRPSHVGGGVFSRLEFNYGDEPPPLSKAQQQREKEYQIRISETRRKLLPMWGDVETSRDQLVKSIARRGVYQAVESAGSPRRENTLELVKQAKLMELRELERKAEEEARRESEEGKNPPPALPLVVVGASSSSSAVMNVQSPAPLLSSPSTIEGSSHGQHQPLLTKQSDYVIPNIVNSSSSLSSKNPSTTTINMNKVPLLSTQSTINRPLLSTDEFYTSSMIVENNINNNKTNLHQPIRPSTSAPSREGTPPPRNPNPEQQHQQPSPTPMIPPLLSTNASYINNINHNKNNSFKPPPSIPVIPSDSMAVMPPSAAASSSSVVAVTSPVKSVVQVKNKAMLVPPAPPPPPPAVLARKKSMVVAVDSSAGPLPAPK